MATKGHSIEELIGLNLKRAREKQGKTQEELGQALEEYLGRPWSRQAVSIAETGGRAFVIAEVFVLAMVLRVPITSFLNIEVIAPPKGEKWGKLTLPSGKNVDARLPMVVTAGIMSFDDDPDGFDRAWTVEAFQRIRDTAEAMTMKLELLTDSVGLLETSQEILIDYVDIGMKAAGRKED